MLVVVFNVPNAHGEDSHTFSGLLGYSLRTVVAPERCSLRAVGFFFS